MALTAEEQRELEQLQAELSSPEMMQAPEVIQEQHPSVGFGTRALIKNLGQSPESGAEYLRQKGLEADVLDGQIIVRAPGEKEFRVVDPSGFDVQDITDIGYDVGAGVTSGIATGAAGLAAGAASGGAAALPAAVATGGATSAGLEALRQKLGQALGLPQQVSGRDVAVAGTVGAVAPGLFGTGARVGTGLASKIAAPAIARAPSQAAVQAGQRGLIQRGFERTTAAGTKVAELFTGVPKKATEVYMKNPKAIKQLAEEGAEVELAATVKEGLETGLQDMKSKVGAKMAEEIDSAKGPLDISKVKSSIYGAISKMESSDLGRTPAYQRAIQAFKKEADDIFTEKTLVEGVNEKGEMISQEVMEQIPDRVSARTAFEVQDLLRDIANYRKYKGGIAQQSSASSALERQFESAGKKAYAEVNDLLSEATKGTSAELKKSYASYMKLQNALAGRFKDPQTTFKTLQNLYSPANKPTLEAIRDLEAASGGAMSVLPKAEQLYTAKYYANPALTELSGGTTGTARLLRAAGIGGYMGFKVGGIPGAAFGAALGSAAASPKVMRDVFIPAGVAGARAGRAAGQALRPVVTPANVQSVWQSMRER